MRIGCRDGASAYAEGARVAVLGQAGAASVASPEAAKNQLFLVFLDARAFIEDTDRAVVLDDNLDG